MSGSNVPPALAVQANGVAVITDANLNTFVQGATLLANLRAFVGVSNMTVWMNGTVTAGDGGQGMFYWNSSSTAADDGGATTIAPNGLLTGRWLRLSSAGDYIEIVSNIAALRALTTVPSNVVFVQGYVTVADGGGGPYCYNPEDISSGDNGGTIIVDVVGHRWYLETLGRPATAEQFGADATGAQASAAPITAAMDVYANGVTPVGPGTYKLGAAVTVDNAALMVSGATFTDPSNLPGLVDTSVVGTTPLFMCERFSNAGTSEASSGNQWEMSIQALGLPTGSAAALEKGALLISVEQTDTSTYGTSSILRDMVGIECVSQISDTSAGRVWCYHALAQVNAGADGFALAMDAQVVNNGTNSLLPTDQELGKFGLGIDSSGSNPATSAICIFSGSSTFNYGLVMEQGAITTSTGVAILIPNAIPISAWSFAGLPLEILYLDASNNCQVGSEAAGVILGNNTYPNADDTYSCGILANRWTAVYAVNGTIQTSDPKLKTAIAAAPAIKAAVLNAAAPIMHGWANPPKDGSFSGTDLWGFDATKVQAAFKAANVPFGGVIADKKGTLHVAPLQLLAALWRMVMEQDTEIAALKRAMP